MDRLQIGGKKIGEKYVDQSLAQVEKSSMSTLVPLIYRVQVCSGCPEAQLFVLNFTETVMVQGTPVFRY